MHAWYSKTWGDKDKLDFFPVFPISRLRAKMDRFHVHEARVMIEDGWGTLRVHRGMALQSAWVLGTKGEMGEPGHAEMYVC